MVRDVAEIVKELHTPVESLAEWEEIPVSELREWSDRLAREENASIRQYPFYNERFRGAIIRPVYLRCPGRLPESPAFVSVLTFGVPPFKCGVVINGPVPTGNGIVDDEQIASLMNWLRASRYAFVRFSHSDRTVMDHFAELPIASGTNPFPFIPRYGGELAVRLVERDADLLGGFQQIARRDIRKAAEAGCLVTKSNAETDLSNIWPMYARRASKKRISLGSVKNHRAMFKLAPRPDSIRVYTASYNGRPVYSAVFLREHSTVYYYVGALDSEALGDRPTPSCFLHWEAMRDYRDAGCAFYNLGGRSGSVYQFKKKFRPIELPAVTSATLVFRARAHRFWTRMVLPVIEGLLRSGL